MQLWPYVSYKWLIYNHLSNNQSVAVAFHPMDITDVGNLWFFLGPVPGLTRIINHLVKDRDAPPKDLNIPWGSKR